MRENSEEALITAIVSIVRVATAKSADIPRHNAANSGAHVMISMSDPR